MIESLEPTKQEFLSDLSQADTLEKLEQVRIAYLARSGKIPTMFDGIKNASPTEKPVLGKSLNELRAFAQSQFDAKKAELERNARPKTPALDLTLPGRPRLIGTKHPITRSMEEMKRIFISMGFSVADGPEIESDYYNFGALNFAPDHPARDMQDTFFITKDVLLRTHTSPVQIRVMEKQKPPVRVIMPGRVFRNEAVSARSHVVFHQIEGLYVDQGVTFSDLKGTLVSFAKQFYGSKAKYRFRPSYFPFTEPSAEMDISCYICGGKGCRVCKYSGWLEIVGSGMVHPNVLRNVGYDSEKFTGFAFGFGVERPTMLLHGIDDIRLLFDNDVRFLRQF